jgi:hypothetical protein
MWSVVWLRRGGDPSSKTQSPKSRSDGFLARFGGDSGEGLAECIAGARDPLRIVWGVGERVEGTVLGALIIVNNSRIPTTMSDLHAIAGECAEFHVLVSRTDPPI